MLLTVREFCARTTRDMPGLVLDLQQATGRRTPSEERAWTNSLTRVAEVLGVSDLGDAHVQVGHTSVSVEYRLPAASNWCDVVLLGRGQGRPRAVVLELKDWDTVGDRPGPRANLVEHGGRLALHPADQVRGYVEYCRAFHSGVATSNADVVGCAFFTKAQHVSPYLQPPHDKLTAEYPVFSSTLNDLQHRLPRWLESQIQEDDAIFAQVFESGSYRQDRGLVRQVAQSIEDSDAPYFVLLDEQRLGYELCLATIDEVLTATGTRKKATVIVEGPPGSGKSILAMRLWAHLAKDDRVRGNVAFVTTSGCQKSNWVSLFANVAGNTAASGMVVPANRFNPGMTTSWVAESRGRGYHVEIDTWKENLLLHAADARLSRMPNDSIDVAIVDEAHALIDPTAPGARGVSPSGWTMHAGPQAWHIQRASRISIFLLDPAQSYRDNETTSAESIERYAQDNGTKLVRRVDLSGAQFRCGGSRDYLDWLDGLLGLRSGPVTCDWRKEGERGAFEFELADDPSHLETQLRRRWAEGRTVRLASSYSRPWRTKGVVAPHELPPAEQDFQFTFDRDGAEHTWSRIWNFAPAEDYTLFIQALPGTRMFADPLCEVGCPYVLRGFDFDYVGLLWGRDLVWRGRWEIDLEHVHESGLRNSIGKLRRAPRDEEAQRKVRDRVIRGYRILLSRALRGTYLWIEDAETRDHVLDRLGRGPTRRDEAVDGTPPHQ